MISHLIKQFIWYLTLLNTTNYLRITRGTLIRGSESVRRKLRDKLATLSICEAPRGYACQRQACTFK